MTTLFFKYFLVFVIITLACGCASYSIYAYINTAYLLSQLTTYGRVTIMTHEIWHYLVQGDAIKMSDQDNNFEFNSDKVIKYRKNYKDWVNKISEFKSQSIKNYSYYLVKAFDKRIELENNLFLNAGYRLTELLNSTIYYPKETILTNNCTDKNEYHHNKKYCFLKKVWNLYPIRKDYIKRYLYMKLRIFSHNLIEYNKIGVFITNVRKTIFLPLITNLNSSIQTLIDRQEFMLKLDLIFLLTMYFIIGSLSIYIYNRHKKDLEKTVELNSTQIKHDTILHVFKNLNHELKGLVMRLLNTIEELQSDNKMFKSDNDNIHHENTISTLRGLISHLTFSLSTLETRMSNFSIKRNLLLDVDLIKLTLNSMLPEIKINDSFLNFHYTGDINLFYAVLYQICRNAIIHGNLPIVLDSPTSYCLKIKNNHGLRSRSLIGKKSEEILDILLNRNQTDDDEKLITSTGYGLKDVNNITKILNLSFDFKVTEDEVICILNNKNDSKFLQINPEIHIESEHQQQEMVNRISGFNSTNDALLILDDALVARLQGKKIMTKLDPDFYFNNLNSWEPKGGCNSLEERIYVCGEQNPDITSIKNWISTMINQNRCVFGLVDYVLEYGGGVVVEGTTVISNIREELGYQNIVLYMRSGNDTLKDEDLFKSHGANGMISKTVPINEIIKILKTDIVINE